MGAESTTPCANCDHEHVEKGFDGRPSNVCFAVHCRCMSYAPKPPAPTLTPSEVALSKVLAAWVEWWVAAPSCGPDGDCMSDVGLSLIKRGVVNRNGTTSPAGAALLDRARKAGVL